MTASTAGDEILQSLNQAQCRAVSSQAPTVAILAGPGSGKTHTLTSRVAWFINRVGYQPCDIIVATFTVKAAREMKERIGRALRDGRERRIILGTFHSIARRYLAAYGQRIGLDPKFGIADDSDSRGIVARICKRLDVQIDVPLARAYISRKKAGGSFNEGPAKGNKTRSVESKAYETCYAEYQTQLGRSNLLDYDDLLVRCVELLRKHPCCVSNIQAVLIDEYQDTNGVQFELMKLFAQYNRRVTIVGDPDQSIYGWRSAEVKNLHRFLQDYPGTEEISLEENYRSSSSILASSLKVIQQDTGRYQKVLLPVHAKGTRPVLRRLRSPMDEADWIVSEVRRAKLMSGDMITSNDIAILLRSASLSRHIESALGKAGMAYRMVGGFKFYERIEVKAILDYLRIIHQPDNNDALARIINVPKRGIGLDTVKALVEEAERNSLSLWGLLVKHCRGDRTARVNIRKQTEQKISGELLKLINNLRTRLRERTDGTTLDLVGVIEQLLKDLQFEKFLEDSHPQDHESRWANIQEFVGLAAEFTKDQALAEEDLLPEIEGIKQDSHSDMLARFLANISLAADKQTDDKDQESKPLITVSTIHAAKGLEWPIVFIPAVYKGSIPHTRSEDDAEERRLLYVAMTRAQALLYLSHPLYSSHGDGSSLELSPFIQDLSANYFLQRGPSLDRRIMSEVASIVRRVLPPEETIYKNMPPMTPVEDNLFPVDPNQSRQREGASNEPSNPAHRLKRHKTHHGSSSTQIAPESVEGWNTPYTTTMQRSSSFTLPGFTTAGAQHLVNAAEQTAAPRPTAPPTTKMGTNRRPPGQRSLLGYVVKEHDQSKLELPAPPPTTAFQRQFSLPSRHAPGRQPSGAPSMDYPAIGSNKSHPQLPAPATGGGIQPDLAAHKLGTGKLAASKPVPPRTRYDDSVVTTARPYACFSSSPTRPSTSPSKEKSAEPTTAPTNNNKKRGHDDGDDGGEEPAAPEEHTRPAMCFHATTVNVPHQGFRGFKRPVGLRRDGIAPIDRLRRPFKPLTINRQGK